MILDPNGGVGDGCNNINKLVSGAIALFAFNSNDECTGIDRCNKAAVAGAVGCLIYTDLIVLFFLNIMIVVLAYLLFPALWKE